MFGGLKYYTYICGVIKINTMFKKYWSLLILILSVYAVGEISIEFIIGFDVTTQIILNYIDYTLSGIFLLDFFYGFFKTNNKLKYVKSNYLDFLSSLPAIPFIKLLRITKIFKVFKILRGFRELKPFIEWLSERKVVGILISYTIILLIIVFYSSLLFFRVEYLSNNNVNNLFDSFWWAFTTLTSVGYGDIYPITTLGRLIAMFLTITGMGFFSVITAEISVLFMGITKPHINKD